MSDSNSLFDFYDCNSSNSFLKFEASSPLFELSPPSSNGPQSPLASNQLGSDSNDKKDKLKMDSTLNNPLLTTASMPIPARNVSSNSNMSNNSNIINNNNNSNSSSTTRMLNDFSDVIFEFENSKSPIFLNTSSNSNETLTSVKQQLPMVINYGGDNNLYTTAGGQQDGSSFNPNNILMWELNPMMATTAMDQSNGSAADKSGPFQMDEDDIFQVDKSDLIQGPTLAELNGENLLVDLINIEDILTDSNQYQQQIINGVGGNGGLQNSQLTQLTAVNFQNLQNAINESSSTTQQLSPGSNQFHTIAIPQTPHNTPIPSFQTNSGGQIIFYDDPTSSGSPYDVYSPPNTLTISTTLRNVQSTPNQLSAFSPGSHSSTSTSSIVLNSSLSPPPSANTPIRGSRGQRTGRSIGLVQHNPKYSTLKSLLTEKALNNAQNSTTSQGSALSPSGLPTRRLNMQGGGIVSRLSSSAPTAFGLEQIWARREPRPHLLSTGSLAEGQQGSTSSLSGEILSPENIDYSQDDSDDDSDHYEDFTSDSDDEDNKDKFRSLMTSDSNNNQKGSGNFSSKKSRFFWQYNVQAKGPKGQRLVIKTQQADPHHLSEATDPVFSPNCSIRGIKSVQIKHSGKARKGDGNDLQPNARKLNSIGKELDKLGRIINDMTPVSELPFNVRPKTRKEKNKLASRACRLKKKAQHEANKIKLFGLEHEHKRLINGIAQMKQLLAMKCSSSHDKQEEINQRMEQVQAKATAIEIAKNSTDYVNRVLERSKAGVPNGGLEDF